MPYLQPALANRIDQKLKKLQSLRPLPPSAVRKLKEQFEIEMTYNSNAIEGNSLTLKETYLVIHEGLTIKGKPLKDHLEAKDHHEALEFLYEIVQHDSHPTLSEHLIRTLHQLVMKKTDEEFAGKYRNSNVFIGGADHIPPDALLVPAEMKKLMNWFVREIKHLHSIELASLLHHKLVYIHPFFDGNGRTGRLLLNLFLLKNGFPPAVILKADRQKYYTALRKADSGDYSKLTLLLFQSIERTFDLYLSAISSDFGYYKPIDDIVKEESVPYGQEYISLLARKGKINAYKDNGVWFTTKEAVSEYIVGRKRKRTDLKYKC